jgi:hypothetical protein
MYSAARLARNTAIPAKSSARPLRPIMVRAAKCRHAGRVGGEARVQRLITNPGTSALHVTPWQIGADGLGYDSRAAREVSTPSGLNVCVVPGNGICILQALAGGGACSGSLARALQQGDLSMGKQGRLVNEQIANGTKMFIGVVPTTDSVPRVCGRRSALDAWRSVVRAGDVTAVTVGTVRRCVGRTVTTRLEGTAAPHARLGVVISGRPVVARIPGTRSVRCLELARAERGWPHPS